MWIHTYTFGNDKANHSRPFHLTLLHPFFSTLFLSFLYAFSHVALSFTLSYIQLLSFRPYSHPRTLFRLSHSRFLPPFFLTPIRSPFLFPFSYRFFLFWKRYRYPPLCLNCRSRDSRPRRARLRGLPPATILPTQQQQGRFTSLIPRHLSSLRD